MFLIVLVIFSTVKSCSSSSNLIFDFYMLYFKHMLLETASCLSFKCIVLMPWVLMAIKITSKKLLYNINVRNNLPAQLVYDVHPLCVTVCLQVNYKVVLPKLSWCSAGV